MLRVVCFLPWHLFGKERATPRRIIVKHRRSAFFDSTAWMRSLSLLHHFVLGSTVATLVMRLLQL